MPSAKCLQAEEKGKELSSPVGWCAPLPVWDYESFGIHLQEHGVSGKPLRVEGMKYSVWSGPRTLRTLICMRTLIR